MPVTAGPLYACNPATARSESTKLGVDPKGEKIVYTNGRAVIIRDLANPTQAIVYTEHTTTVTVARISPSGFYCASADIAGNVRVWDIAGADKVLKIAVRPLSGKINDLAWDGESKRIIVGGEGKDKFGAAFFIDSGNACGEIAGHAKTITSLAIRHQRPFRAISGSDDNNVILHTGVPFKYEKMISNHTRFVRDVAYSPNGELFASVGSDGKLFVYEGKDGGLKASGARDGSTGSLMACSWSPDSTKIATAGADGVVAVWDANTAKPISFWAVGSDILSQQNGVVFANNQTVVSISLSGVLNVFNVGEPSTWRKLYGPTKSITSSIFADKEQLFYAGSFDGSIKAFSFAGSGEAKEGDCANIEGSGHTARVSGLADDGQGKIWSAGWDDKVANIQGTGFTSNTLPAKAQPSSIAATPAATYIATSAGLEIHPSSGPSSVHPGATSAVAAFASSGSDTLAFGAGTKKVVLASAANGQVKVEAEFEDNKGEILALAFSPDGGLLAAGDAAGRIILINVKEKKVTVSSKWTFHTGRIAQLSFSPNGRRIASAGLDESIYVWEVEKTLKNTAIKNAHPGGVTGVSWVGSSTKLVSAGADACVRTWTVPEI